MFVNQSRLEVVTPAANALIVSSDEIASATGLPAGLQADAMAARIHAMIMVHCNIAYAANGIATLKKERLKETFFALPRNRNKAMRYVEQIFLSRRHNVSLVSVKENTAEVALTDAFADPESGIVQRFSGSSPSAWCVLPIEVIYDAGFDAVPIDLSSAAVELARFVHSESTRDMAVKGYQTEVPGALIKSVDYWVGALPGMSAGAVTMPANVAASLHRYKNILAR